MFLHCFHCSNITSQSTYTSFTITLFFINIWIVSQKISYLCQLSCYLRGPLLSSVSIDCEGHDWFMKDASRILFPLYTRMSYMRRLYLTFKHIKFLVQWFFFLQYTTNNGLPPLILVCWLESWHFLCRFQNGMALPDNFFWDQCTMSSLVKQNETSLWLVRASLDWYQKITKCREITSLHKVASAL